MNGELIWTFVSYSSIFISGVLIIKALTTLMSPEEYGKLNLFSSAIAFFVTIIVSPLMQGSGRYYDIKQPIKTFKIIIPFLRKIGWSLVLFLLLAVVFFSFEREFKSSLFALLLFFIYILEMAREWNISIFLMSRERKRYAISTSIFNWGKLILAAGLILFFRSVESVILVLVGWILSSFLANLYSVKINWHKYIEEPSISEKKSEQDKWTLIKKYAFSFLLLNIFIWIQNWSDRWVLDILLSKADKGQLGIYVSYYQIAMVPFTALTGIITMYASPILFGRINLIKGYNEIINFKRNILRIYKIYFLIAFAGLIALWFLRGFIFEMMLGHNYRADSPIFIFLCIGSLLFNFTQLQSLSIQCSGNAHYLIAPNVISGLLSVSTNLFLVSKFGVIGAAYSLAIIMSVKVILMSYYEKISWTKFKITPSFEVSPFNIQENMVSNT